MNESVLPLRSMLFIPGDSEKKLAKVADCGADAVIFDLEDAVSPENKPLARKLVPEYMAQTRPGSRPLQYWVRVNPFDTGMTLDDLVAVCPAAPDGIMQPKIDGPGDVGRLSNLLDAFEAAYDLERGSIRILPVATETPLAPFALGQFASASLERLHGLTWGAEDLSSAIGASTNLEEGGRWAETYRMVRSQCLLAGHASGVQVLDTAYVDFRDDEGLRKACRTARAEGFTGRIAIHPAQVAGINESFMPSVDEVKHARRVIEAFEARPGEGAVGLDGKMLDIPHRKQAEKVLRAASAYRLDLD